MTTPPFPSHLSPPEPTPPEPELSEPAPPEPRPPWRSSPEGLEQSAHPRRGTTTGQSPRSLIGSFLALPAATAFLFLISAACLLGGVCVVLHPLLGRPDALGECFAVLATLHGYEACLALAGLLLCRFVRGNHDAIGIVMLQALFVIATCVALDATAVSAPCATLLIGALGVLLAVAKAVLARRACGLAQGSWWLLGMGLLCAWNALMPGLLGLNHDDPDRPRDVLVYWWPGVAVLLLAGFALLRDAEDPFADCGKPFLLRPAMRRIVALIALSASCGQALILGEMFGVLPGFGDVLPLVALIVLILRVVLARRGSAFGDLALMLGLLLVTLVLARSDAHTALIGSTPLTSGVLCLAGLRLGFALRRPGHLRGAGAAAVCCALTLLSEPGWRGFSPALAAFTATAAAVLLALCERQPRWWCVAATAYAIAIGLLPSVRASAVSLPALALAACGLAVLLTAWRVPNAIAPWQRRLAAALLCIGVLWLCLPARSGLHAPLLGSALITAVLAIAALRLRDPWVLTPLLPPGLLLLKSLLPRNPGWWAVIAAFALLALGVWLSRRRQTPLRPAPSAAATAAEPRDEREPDPG